MIHIRRTLHLAGRRLKMPCNVCGQPIERGDIYHRDAYRGRRIDWRLVHVTCAPAHGPETTGETT